LPKDVMTPRTAQRYAACKKRTDYPTIKVQPLGNVTRITRKRPETAHTV
jgi:hypothetical protein